MLFRISILLGCLLSTAISQPDSIDVTFRYTPSGIPSVVHLAGEFNNWANNSNGSINPGAGWTMARQADGSWRKTVRLKINGGTGPGGSYQYKFNENGSPSGWLADPLNPRTFGSFGNSILYVRAPTVFQITPVSGSVAATERPVIQAGVFAAPNSTIDPAMSKILLDHREIAAFSGRYDASTGMLSDTLPVTADGIHVLTVIGVNDAGGSAADSVVFTVRGAPLQWLTRSNPRVYDSSVTVKGVMVNATVTDIRVIRNGTDTVVTTVTGTEFSARLQLSEGDNTFVAIGLHGAVSVRTDSVILTRVVDHDPHPVITYGFAGSTISLNAVTSTDPDGDPLTFRWRSEDERNPAPLGIDRGGAVVTLPVPAAPGEYFVSLVAEDPSRRIGKVRGYFTVRPDSSVTFPTVNTNPQWVKDAIVYEIFVPAFSASGTLRGVTDNFSRITSLGVNTIWLMPIMNNRGPVTEMNGGYDIIDFRDVDESLGTLDDFRALRDSCHANGLKLILDITPNHVSAEHPWVQDIRRWRDESIYRGFIEHRLLGNARDLGQSITSDNGYPLYAHYSNWSLANLNLSSPATFHAMMDVFRFWCDTMRADGFRMDVYWGPQNRYGSDGWWRPFREEIKRTKPDLFLLGETDGTGTGTEANYADGGGALDAGYDWNWYGQAKTTLSAGDVMNMHNRTANYSPNLLYNHYTGPNASYFRFLENHDEDRIAQIFGSQAQRTLPSAALLLTAPGIPMIYAGQEVGWKGRRDKIDFGAASGAVFLPYYRTLVRIRNEQPALRSPRIKLVPSATSGVYSFLRPHRDANILVLVNFNAGPSEVRCSLDERDLDLTRPLTPGRSYYFNDLLNDSSYAIAQADLGGLRFALGAWQSRVLRFSDSAQFPIATSLGDLPLPPGEGVMLEQCHPHPVSLLRHGSASIGFRVPDTGGHSRHGVTIQLFTALGTPAAQLIQGQYPAGSFGYSIPSTILRSLRPGLYFCRLMIQSPDLHGTTVHVRPVCVVP